MDARALAVWVRLWIWADLALMTSNKVVEGVASDEIMASMRLLTGRVLSEVPDGYALLLEDE